MRFSRLFNIGIVFLLLFFIHSNSSAQKLSCPGHDYYDMFPSMVLENGYFSNIYIGDSETKSIRIHAGNKNPLTISAISDDPSGIFTIEAPTLPVTLENQGSITLKITFRPQEAKDYNVIVKVQSNAYGTNGTIYLSGRGLMPLKPNLAVSGNVDFGRHRIGTKATPGSIILENTGNAPALILSASLNSQTNGFSFPEDAFKNLVIEPQQVIRVPVTFTPGEKGFSTAEISITTQDGPGHSILLKGAGTIGEIFSYSGEITFPATELNSPALQAEAVITCADGEFAEPVTITTLERNVGAYCDDIDKNSFALQEIALPLTLQPGASVRIPVAFKAFSAGEKVAELNVMSDANALSFRLIGQGKVSEDRVLSVENNAATEKSVIKYSLSGAANVKISVYNINGQIVQTIENQDRTPGLYESVINNKALPAGAYFINIRSTLFNETRSFVIIR
jgi:hypothetical protein